MEVINIFIMGAIAFELLDSNYNPNIEEWTVSVNKIII